MADTDRAALRFLPWVRQGAAATLGDGGAVELKLAVNGKSVTVPMRVIGPGSVTGLDRKQIIRMEPKPGTLDFPPFHFPAIEFDRPDFPWLFTPARADGNERLKPWLCLVVVRKQSGVKVSYNQGAPLPFLEIRGPARPGAELPDLAESWAWGHAQIAGRSGTAPPEESLRGDPSLTLSRLICPRKLESDAEYLACVVPTFETGRQAGLGLAVDEEKLAPAWGSGAQAPAEIVLPVYFHWEFRAGPPSDFESLVRLLEARPLSEKVGRRPLWIGAAGSGLPRLEPDADGAVLLLEGALKAPGASSVPWPSAPREQFQKKLSAILNAPADALTRSRDDVTFVGGHSDPIVAPPIYGQWHALMNRVEKNGAPPWLHQLNLDPRHRVAAGWGAEAVRRDQEALMGAAWEQVGEMERANRLLRQAQLARAAGVALHKRHFAVMPETTLLRVTAPVHGRLAAVTQPHAAATASSSPGTARMSLRAQLASSTSRAEAGQVALRKAVRSQGPLLRQAARTRAFLPNLPVFTIGPSTVTIENVTDAVFAQLPDRRAKVRTFGAAPLTMDTSIPERPGFIWVFTLHPEEGERVINGHWERRRVGETERRKPPFAEFAAAAGAHEAALPRPKAAAVTPLTTLMGLKASVLTQLNPMQTVAARVLSRLQFGPDPSSAPTTPAGGDPLDTIMASPEFPAPMYEALRNISSDALLPGLEHVPPNTVTLMETNPPFIEAFMAGLNFEMGRELLWREFPTDQRGTYFRQFWAAANPEDHRQILSMHRWKKALGEHSSLPSSLVLLLRGELLRRYPNTVIYAVRAKKEGARRIPGTEEKYPLFRGSLEPDVTFLGFDIEAAKAAGNDSDPGWFFVIQEQPTAPRFGLDKAEGFASTIPEAKRWSDLSWGHLAKDQAAYDAITHVPVSGPLPDTSAIQDAAGVIWGRNAAHVAYATWQQPVRIAIHASNMIPRAEPAQP